VAPGTLVPGVPGAVIVSLVTIATTFPVSVPVPISASFVIAIPITPTFTILVASAVIVPLTVAAAATPTTAVISFTRLAVVDRAIAAALEAVLADVVIGAGAAGLAVVDRAITAAFEAIFADVVGEGAWRCCAACLSRRRLRGSRKHNRSRDHARYSSFHMHVLR
jgi:hypothetical protein